MLICLYILGSIPSFSWSFLLTLFLHCNIHVPASPSFPLSFRLSRETVFFSAAFPFQHMLSHRLHINVQPLQLLACESPPIPTQLIVGWQDCKKRAAVLYAGGIQVIYGLLNQKYPQCEENNNTWWLKEVVRWEEIFKYIKVSKPRETDSFADMISCRG